MCRPHTAPNAAAKRREDAVVRSSTLAGMWTKIWPLPVPLVLVLIPLLPHSAYLNRGYTVWFHLSSVAYFLTRSAFLRRVLILQGTAICVGWYAAIANDWFVDGIFCHSLYRNMPGAITQHMLREVPGEDGGKGSYEMFDHEDMSAVMAKVISHVLDTLGHPLLAYLFWVLHRKAGGTLKDVLSWPVIVFAWHFSRVWSLVHSHHNAGTPALWYHGHDVYMLENLDCYLVAYVAEGLCFGAATLCRANWDRLDRSQSLSTMPLVGKGYYEGVLSGAKGDEKPALVHSESAVSTSSLIESHESLKSWTLNWT
ncbi:hypothetical protein ACHAXT_003724 [Thalassiosira profunda]